MRTLMGRPAMKVISKYGIQEEPYTYRRYLSINTEILGQIIKNATGRGLAEYMEEKLRKRIDAAHDAYWTLSNGTELAMGGLSVSLIYGDRRIGSMWNFSGRSQKGSSDGEGMSMV